MDIKLKNPYEIVKTITVKTITMKTITLDKKLNYHEAKRLKNIPILNSSVQNNTKTKFPDCQSLNKQWKSFVKIY